MPVQTPTREPGEAFANRDLSLGMLEVRALPETYDEKRGTVTVVWSTGARVRRTDWGRDEDFWEELSLDPRHINLARLNKGAPVVDSHSTHDGIEGVLGVVERAWIEGGRGLAEVRFDLGAERGREAARKTREGILRNWSIGYEVAPGGWIELPPQRDGDLRVRRAVDWTVYELSIVPIGADEDAQTRAQERATHQAASAPAGGPVTMPEQTTTDDGQAPAPAASPNTPPAGGERSQPRTTPTTETPPPSPTPTPVDVDAQVQRAVRAEAERSSMIRSLCRKHGIEGALEDELLAPGMTVDSARSKVLDHLAARSDSTPIRSGVRIGGEGIDLRRAAVQNALEHRLIPGTELSEEGRSFRGLSLLEVGRDLLEAQGVRTRGLAKMEVAKLMLGRRSAGYLGTSDFPSLLENVGAKVLRKAFMDAPQTFRQWVGEVQLSDFKPTSMPRLSDVSNLEEVGESGEFTYGSLGEEKETIQGKTYGVIVPMTRQMVVNDDLGAFTSMTLKLARRALQKESDLVYARLGANPTMGDGNPLFDAGTHGNAGSGAIGDTALTAGKLAMGMQADLKGSKLDIRPRFLLCPLALQNEAQKYLSQNIVPIKASETNPHRGTLEIIADPRLDDISAVDWYLVADPADAPLLCIGYVDGQRTPVFEEDVGFEVDGVAFKVRHDFAVAPCEFRGGWFSDN